MWVPPLRGHLAELSSTSFLKLPLLWMPRATGVNFALITCMQLFNLLVLSFGFGVSAVFGGVHCGAFPVHAGGLYSWEFQSCRDVSTYAGRASQWIFRSLIKSVIGLRLTAPVVKRSAARRSHDRRLRDRLFQCRCSENLCACAGFKLRHAEARHPAPVLTRVDPFGLNDCRRF